MVALISLKSIPAGNYGGSQGSRARFLLEIVAVVSATIGAYRLGVRLSPFGQSAIPFSRSVMRFSSCVKLLLAFRSG